MYIYIYRPIYIILAYIENVNVFFLHTALSGYFNKAITSIQTDLN
jgi:hypothetical protein